MNLVSFTLRFFDQTHLFIIFIDIINLIILPLDILFKLMR